MEGGDLRMSGVDERIVRMKFDNQQFEQGVSTTLASLNKLNNGLKLEGGTKGLTDIEAASNKISLSHISDSVEGIANKFKTMSLIAITALTNIVNRAVDAGVNITKSLTISPIKAGLEEYETNLNSIQTILANTAHEHTNLQQVNAALAELNHYSDQTIYNFGEMARNIGTFTAAGVSLKTSTEAIKGIANLAAVSGSNSEQASTAMYQLSQALAAGKVTLMDWNSVVNAGMGGKVLQDSLMETARVHGVAIDKMVKDAGGFRNTLEKGWLTSEILTETLSKFTGDLNEQQLKTMGYSKKQITDIIAMGKVAQDAATKVKTMSQLIGTLQEAAGSGWAQTWQMLFGDFEEAKTLFTNVNNVIGGFISNSADARNKVIGDWKALGGRTVLIDGIANAFNALVAVVKPIREAFREIFPATTGKQLYDMTVTFRDFTEKLKIGAETAAKIKTVFTGFFSLLDIGWMVVKEGIKTLFEFFGAATKGSGSVLDFAVKVGEFLTRLRDAIKEGDLIPKVFDKIQAAVAAVVGPLKTAVEKIEAFLKSFRDVKEGFKSLNKDLSGDKLLAGLAPLDKMGDTIGGAWKKVLSVLDDVWAFFEPMAKKMGNIFKTLGTEVAGAFHDIDYKTVLATINTALLGGLVLLIKKFVTNMGNVGGAGILESIQESFEGLTKTLGSMQDTLRAAVLLEIAFAIGALAVSAMILSRIEPKALAQALGAITVLFAELFASMAVFERIMGTAGFAKIITVAAAMIPLAIAVDLLTIAVKKLSELDMHGLIKGLGGVGVLMAELVAAVNFMPPTEGLIATGVALVILSGAIKILASAVTDLSKLDWKELARGLVGVGALLGALTLFTMFSEASAAAIPQAIGIVILAAGIKILASAVKDFAEFSWKDLAKGLGALAVSLTLIGAALYLIPPTAVLGAAGILVTAASLGLIADAIGQMGQMHGKEIAKGVAALAGALTLIAAALYVLPPSSLLSAAAILVVAASLNMIVDALKDMGDMTKKEIAKGLIALAGSLGIIATAMYFMTTALPGAAALLVVAASLTILLPVLKAFGDMSWEEMGKGLLMLAGVFVVLGAAGYLLTPVVPTLLGLGAAVVLLGAGMALAGVGVLAFAAGLTALSIAGAAGAAAIVAIVSGLVGLIPYVMEQIGLGLIAFAKTISTAGPAILEALTTVLLSLLDAIDKITPKLVDTLIRMLDMLISKMEQYVPRMVRTGLSLLLGVMHGIQDNIEEVVATALDIVANFIRGVADGLPGVIQAGYDLIISFINGLANAIRSNSKALGDAGGNLASAIVEGMIQGLRGGIGKIAQEAKRVAQSALDAAKDFLDINSPSRKFIELGKSSSEGMAVGLSRFAYMVEKPAENLGVTALSSLQKTLSGLDEMLPDDIGHPTITPVLDLSAVEKSSAQLATMLSDRTFSVSTSTSGAKAASNGYLSNLTASANQAADEANIRGVTFNQYNNSPKALSAAEVYRQTKNQLSVAKGALPVG
jgi:tape measure domain-containing protein